MREAEQVKNGGPPDVSGEDVFVFPTTFAQRRFWLLDRLVPGGNASLNVALSFRLEGKLDRAVLERALNGLVRRHETLRTSFRTVDGDLVQVIHPEASVRLEYSLLDEPLESEREAKILRIAADLARKPFVLTAVPLIRAQLIGVSSSESYLALTTHQIACDGWSQGILVRELVDIYSALLSGVELPELPLQYADYAQWQKEWIASPPAAQQAEYWRSTLRSPLPMLQLPTDTPRRCGRGFPGALATLSLDRPLCDSIKSYCLQNNLTPFMFFLGVYATVLHRCTGKKDIICGSTAGNRDQTELEGLIGFFANPQILRLDVSGDPTMRVLFSRIREISLGAVANHSYPFERILEELDSGNAFAGLPLLQVYFVYQRDFVLAQEIPGLRVTPLKPLSTGALFEWTLAVLENEQGIRLQLEYNAELFHDTTMVAVLDRLQRVAAETLLNDQSRLSQIPILSEMDTRCLQGWVAPRRSVPDSRAVHECFEEHVIRSPDNPALRDVKWVVTRRELNEEANQLAHHLRRGGIVAGSRVGLLVSEGTHSYAIGFLGILKSGGSVVHLDPRRLNADLSLLAKHLEITLAVSATGAYDSSPLQISGCRLVDLNSSALQSEPRTNLGMVISPDQEACVRLVDQEGGAVDAAVFTHRALALGSLGTIAELRIAGDDAVLLDSFTLLPSLRAGACLVAWKPSGSFQIRAWLEAMVARKVTVAGLSIHAWHELAHEGGSASIREEWPVRQLFLAQGTISAAAAAAWIRSPLARCRVLHLFRALEAFGPAGVLELSFPAPHLGRRRIHRPVSDVRIRILDENGESAPQGVPGRLGLSGEACAVSRLSIAGDSVSMVHPVATSCGGGKTEAVWASGEVGRFLGHEGIEILGPDYGSWVSSPYRLEFSEVRSMLLDQSDLWDVVIESSEDRGRATMTAEVLVKTQPPPEPDSLKAFLSAHLPTYMVPTKVHILSHWPLSASGELDRTHLVSLSQRNGKPAHEVIAPRTVLQARLLQIWQEIFSKSNIGIHDNFFDLGGESLSAIKLFSKVQKLTGKRLPMVSLFRAPTIEGLASLIESNDFEAGWKCLVPIKSSGKLPPFYCVHGVGGNILEFEHFSTYIDADQPLYGIQAQGLDGRSVRHQRVEDMAAHYVTEIRRFQPEGPYFLGGSSFGGLVAYEIAQQLTRCNQKVGVLVMFDTWAPGHPRFHPTTTRWHRMIDGWRMRWQLHWSNFIIGDSASRKKYVLSKFGRLRRRWGNNWQDTVKAVKSRFQPDEIRSVRKAGHTALSHYEAKPYPGVLTLMRASEQPRGIIEDRTNGWSTLALGGVEVHDVPGHHGSLMREPRTRGLIEKLTICLRRAYAGSSPQLGAGDSAGGPSAR